MKKQMFPGIVLIGFGLYFFLQKFTIPVPAAVFSWPTILLIVGVALLIQAYRGGDFQLIVPGVLLVGLGVHFHLAQQWNIQFDLIGVIILFLALGFFLAAKKTKSSSLYSWIFVGVALIQLFSAKLFSFLQLTPEQIGSFQSLWPIVLIIIGSYLFFFKKK